MARSRIKDENSAVEVEDDRKGDPQIEIIDVPDEEMDRSYRYMFEYDEGHPDQVDLLVMRQYYASLLLIEQQLIEDIEKLHQKRASLDDKVSAIRMVTRSFDSEKVKKIKSATRQSCEIGDAIGDMQRKLSDAKLTQIWADAKFKSCTAIFTQDVTRQGEDQCLLFGFLGHVWRLED